MAVVEEVLTLPMKEEAVTDLTAVSEAVVVIIRLEVGVVAAVAEVLQDLEEEATSQDYPTY